ncbi:MAG: FAD-binding protein [Clostridiales bacterium]|nr:FAD-binding protein [Clostridiales bacterium]
MAKKEISPRDFVIGVAAGAVGVAALKAYEVKEAADNAAKQLELAQTVAAGGEAIYTPGTYTATAQGFGEITMSATFSETAITAIELDLSNETESIGGAAKDELIEQILLAQGSNIDGVSGATMTTSGVKKCLEDCIRQAKGEATQEAAPAEAATAAAATGDDWLGEEPEITDDMVEESLTCDVLVIGCGLAGVAACRAAAEEGASVIALEKAGSPQCRSGEFAVINGNVQARWGRNTWTDEQIDDMIDFHMKESCYKVKRAIFTKWAHNIGDIFDWWVEADPDLYYAEETRSPIPDENANDFLIPIFHPLPENYDWTQEKFPCYPTSVEFLPNQSVTFQKNMEAAVDTGNVDARYGHFAEKLIMEDGRCVGAYARNAETGGYVKISASRGVIMATGDYSQNEAMVQHFCPDVIENGIVRMFTNVDVEGNMTNQGDGIKLGMWVGARVQQAHAPMIHHMGGGADLSGVGVMGIAGFLNLDMNGKRFMNEDLPGQQVENQIEIQKDKKTWQIFDANWPEQLPYMPAEHGGACYYEDYQSEAEAPANNATYRNYKSPYQLQAAIEDGRCLTADTLEELVEKMYPDDATAQKTALASIERYNELARNGYDADFGKVSSRLWPLENGPYYADQFETALLLVICGGLESDEDCHTFDENRNIIPGLYVAGNVQGSRFAAEYPITLKGISHSLAMYYGYVAGKNAVNEV